MDSDLVRDRKVAIAEQSQARLSGLSYSKVFPRRGTTCSSPKTHTILRKQAEVQKSLL